MDDALEDLHLRLEEFEHLVELGDRDASICLEQALPKMRDRFNKMHKVFQAVDR